MTEEHAIECTLYVVPLGSGDRLDSATTEVAAVFARSGFAVVVHSGPASEEGVLEGVRQSNASSVLLSTGGHDGEVRRITAALTDVVEYVLAVGHNDPNQREGDRCEPFRIHPDEGEQRMVRLAGFVRRGLQGVGIAIP